MIRRERIRSIRTGSPDLAEWLRTHPNPIVLRATFDFPAMPEATSAKQRAPEWPRDHAGRPWPGDRRGRPWPRDRWGNPSCPLDEYPPGVAAPGTARCDPCDAKSPWFDPVLVLQKVGFLPAYLSGYVQQPNQERPAPDLARISDPDPPREAGANAAARRERGSAGLPSGRLRMPVLDPERGAPQQLMVSDTKADRSADSVGGRAEPSRQPPDPDGDAIQPVPVGPFEVAGLAAKAVTEGLFAALLALARTIAKQSIFKKPPNERTIAGRPITALESGKELDPADKGYRLTKAGRALQKHGGRAGSSFPPPQGNPAQLNERGQKILQRILNNPGSIVKTGNRFNGFDVFSPHGQGARFDSRGNFVSFLELPK